MEKTNRLEWDYSRNNRCHQAFDPQGNEPFSVVSAAPYGHYQAKHGYHLRNEKKETIHHAMSVKKLKDMAETMFAKNKQGTLTER